MLYSRAVLSLLPRARKDTLPDTSLDQRDITVDRDHLAAYNQVCGFRLRDTVPATYPHILAFPLALRLMTRPDFPFPAVGLVHVANRIELLRPVNASEPLTLSVHPADLRPHDRGRQLDIIATATVDGEPVWRDVSTYLRKERKADSRRGERAQPPPPAAVWRVPARIGGDYARVSGDHNPIHTSALAAKLFGFPRRIAHGMWTKARCLAALEGRLPERYTVDVSFKLPVLLPATVAFNVAQAPGEWTFGLHDARSGKPHLTGRVIH